MKSVKEQLCDIFVLIKIEEGYTYDDLVSMCSTKINKEQLTRIIKHKGKNVSCDLIGKLIEDTGYNIEIRGRDKRGWEIG